MKQQGAEWFPPAKNVNIAKHLGIRLKSAIRGNIMKEEKWETDGTLRYRVRL